MADKKKSAEIEKILDWIAFGILVLNWLLDAIKTFPHEKLPKKENSGNA